MTKKQHGSNRKARASKPRSRNARQSMTKRYPEVASKTSQLRNDVLHWTQARLADELGVHQSRVSAWEIGMESPTRENFLILGSIAGVSPELRNWFWRQAGTLLRVAEEVGEESLRERGEALRPGESIRVPCVRRVGHANEETGECTPVPSDRVNKLAATLCVLVDADTKTRHLRPGDSVVVDTSGVHSGDLLPFLDQLLLVDIDPDRPRRLDPGHQLIHWPQGLCIGRLRIKVLLPEPLIIPVPGQPGLINQDHVVLVNPNTWIATLSSLADVNTIWDPAEDSVYLGEWTPTIRPASPDPRDWKAFLEICAAKAPEAIRLEEGCSIIGRVLDYRPGGIAIRLAAPSASEE